MDKLAALEAERVSKKLAFEAAYRVGDAESEEWAMRELIELDKQIAEERRHGQP